MLDQCVRTTNRSRWKANMAHAVCGEVELDSAHLVEMPFGIHSVCHWVPVKAAPLPHKCLFISSTFQCKGHEIPHRHVYGPSWVERKSHVKANKRQAGVTDNMHLPGSVFIPKTQQVCKQSTSSKKPCCVRHLTLNFSKHCCLAQPLLPLPTCDLNEHAVQFTGTLHEITWCCCLGC